jgi:ribosome recycling factor
VKEVEAHAKTRMDKVLSDLQHEMAGIRTGRASVGIFDNLRVDYYGTPTPLNQVANLHVPEPTADHDPALGRVADRRHREGDSRRRPGPESGQRRQDDPRAGSAA